MSCQEQEIAILKAHTSYSTVIKEITFCVQPVFREIILHSRFSSFCADVSRSVLFSTTGFQRSKCNTLKRHNEQGCFLREFFCKILQQPKQNSSPVAPSMARDQSFLSIFRLYPGTHLPIKRIKEAGLFNVMDCTNMAICLFWSILGIPGFNHWRNTSTGLHQYGYLPFFLSVLGIRGFNHWRNTSTGWKTIWETSLGNAASIWLMLTHNLVNQIKLISRIVNIKTNTFSTCIQPFKVCVHSIWHQRNILSSIIFSTVWLPFLLSILGYHGHNLIAASHPLCLLKSAKHFA